VRTLLFLIAGIVLLNSGTTAMADSAPNIVSISFVADGPFYHATREFRIADHLLTVRSTDVKSYNTASVASCSVLGQSVGDLYKSGALIEASARGIQSLSNDKVLWTLKVQAKSPNAPDIQTITLTSWSAAHSALMQGIDDAFDRCESDAALIPSK
jgi:hypothetical protein